MALPSFVAAPFFTKPHRPNACTTPRIPTTTTRCPVSGAMTGATASASAATRAWMRVFVVGLNLCPFASPALRDDTVGLTVDTTVAQVDDLVTSGINALLSVPPEVLETTVIILPNFHPDDFIHGTTTVRGWRMT